MAAGSRQGDTSDEGMCTLGRNVDAKQKFARKTDL